MKSYKNGLENRTTTGQKLNTFLKIDQKCTIKQLRNGTQKRTQVAQKHKTHITLKSKKGYKNQTKSLTQNPLSIGFVPTMLEPIRGIANILNHRSFGQFHLVFTLLSVLFQESKKH